MRAFFRYALEVGKALVEYLVDTMLVPGTNLCGLALFVAAFSPVLVIHQQFPWLAEGLLTLLGGGLCFVFDAGLRKTLAHESWLEFDRGARVVFLPGWLMGLVWILVGSIQGFCALLA